MHTWKQINDDWYVFDENGYMRTGWFKDGENWYYLKKDGSRAHDTVIDGYTLDKNGIMQ